MEQEKTLPRENKMGVMDENKLLITMALPLIISMLVQACYNIVDSVFVAMISEDALTAVSLAFPIQTIMIALGVGTGVGINATLSKALGEKNFTKANKAAANGVFLAMCSFFVSILIGLFVARPFYMVQVSENLQIVNDGVTYLRICCCFSLGIYVEITFERLMQGTGRTIYSMFTQLAGAITNIILDPLMIFGIGPFPEMGVAGAAAATVIGQWVAGILGIILNAKKNPEIQVHLKEIFRPDPKIIGHIYAVGIPSIIMSAIGSVMTFGMDLILVGFTTTAVAVFGAYFKLQSFFFMPVFGMNNALVPIIAYNYGARKKARVIKTIKLGIRYAMCFMLVGMLLFELFPQVLLGMFSPSEDMLAIGIPGRSQFISQWRPCVSSSSPPSRRWARRCSVCWSPLAVSWWCCFRRPISWQRWGGSTLSGGLSPLRRPCPWRCVLAFSSTSNAPSSTRWITQSPPTCKRWQIENRCSAELFHMILAECRNHMRSEPAECVHIPDCKFRKNARIFLKRAVKLRKLHGFLMKAGAICGIVEQNVSARGERP